MQSDQTKLLEVLSRGVAEVLPSVKTLAEVMEKKKIKLYLGIDPTGSLLTLGHSVPLRKLQQFADLGHEVILLIGNGTVRIGDPTGRDSTRPVLTDEQIQEHFKDWKNQASKILDFSKIKLMYNGDWLDKLNYADIIKLSAQTTVQQLIERDMFQERLKKGLPIFGHEIMYPLMQGYDSVAMNVDLEIGGTDQTFNMMMGRHLQRVYNNHEKWVLTTPLINGTDGRKMSKSYGNFVALTEEPNDMYGKLMSIDDSMIIEYFTVLTDEPMHSIEKMKIALEQGQHPLPFKKRLAFTITEMYHTKADAITAERHFEATVQKKLVPEDVPSFTFKDQSMSIIDILDQCKLEMSKSQLRRLIEQGGVEVTLKNSQKVKPKTQSDKFGTVNIDVIRIGKRKFVKIKTSR
jgi:tyrosyl-tRNA synthetase